MKTKKDNTETLKEYGKLVENIHLVIRGNIEKGKYGIEEYSLRFGKLLHVMTH